MTQTLPDPLVPPELDLRDFQFMPLDVRRLRDSRLVAVRTPEEVVAAILLWASSWHQVPASSLPDDDVELSSLAGYGGVRGVSLFRKIKEGALHGFVLCKDGRWYHPVVAEKAADGWNAKLDQQHYRASERVRKENIERKDKGQEELPKPPKPEHLTGRLVDGITVFRQWKTGAVPPPREPVPPERPTRSAGIPPETSPKGEGRDRDSKGTGTGTGTGNKGETPPPSPSSGPARRGEVAGWLSRDGVKVTPAHLHVWVDELNASDDHLREALSRCRVEKPLPIPIPAKYFDTCLRNVMTPPPQRLRPINRQEALENRNRDVVESWRPPEMRDAAG